MNDRKPMKGSHRYLILYCVLRRKEMQNVSAQSVFIIMFIIYLLIHYYLFVCLEMAKKGMKNNGMQVIIDASMFVK